MTTERRTREARTELQDESPMAGQETEDAQEGEIVGDPCAVTLSDGRVYRLRYTDALHDVRLGQRLARMGWSASVVGPEVYGILRALGSVEAIDGEPFRLPKDKGSWEFYMKNLKTADSLRLITAYARLNVPEDLQDGGSATFSTGD